MTIGGPIRQGPSRAAGDLDLPTSGPNLAASGRTVVLAPPRRGFGPVGDYGWRRRVRRLRRLMLALLVLAIAVPPLFVGARVWYVARQDSHPKSDAIVVLGTAQYNGAPSPVLKWRLVHARDLYRKGVAPVIVTVGGKQPADNYTEAGAAKRWLIARGVPEAKVIAVSEGLDTLQSLRAVGAEFDRRGFESAVLVSDPWHALRSRTMARDHGIDAETSPTRSGPIVQTRATQFRYIVRETGGYLYYRTVGRRHLA